MALDGDAIEELLDWMVGGAIPHDNPRDIIHEICDRLVTAGIPVDRFVLFIYTLHPNIKGRRFKWEPGKPVDMANAEASVFTADIYHHNPLPHIIDTKQAVRRPLGRADCPDDYIIVGELREQGFKDYYAQPLVYLNGEVNVATWSTKSEAGFSDLMLEALDRVAKPLTRLTETYLLYLNAAKLLSTYAGRNVGPRILNGMIDRGSGVEIEAVILFVDLKQFTKMSNIHAGPVLIEALNFSLDALVPPVEANGGEVLKFLGDGFFAIFPYKSKAEATKAAHNAIQAVQAGSQNLAEQNQAADRRLSFGVRTAIHAGSFHYGNIGGGDRLDFTAIGPAVNYTARLLSSAAAQNIDHAVSQAAAALLDKSDAPVATAHFKGFDGEQQIFKAKF